MECLKRQSDVAVALDSVGLSSRRGSIAASIVEEEDNRRYGLDNPELPHLAMGAAAAGEFSDDGDPCCRGVCDPSLQCVGAATVAGLLLIFGILVCFSMLEDKHEEKKKLNLLLYIAGGG